LVSKQIDVNGVRLGVELREAGGVADNSQMARGRAIPLVLLHGFTASAASWGYHLDRLAAQGLRVIALDMLGHGASDAPECAERYSLARCQEDILAALYVLGVRQGEAILLGYSMGGRIALYTAFAGFFRALILESASPGIENVAERTQRRLSDEALATCIERDGVAAFVEYWERLPLFASQRRLLQQQQQALHMQRLGNCAVGLAQSLRGAGTGTQPSLWGKLPQLHIPTLLIAGELDTKFSIIARRMAQTLPYVQLQIVPNAGHTVHLEQPEQFDQLVINFCLAKG